MWLINTSSLALEFVSDPEEHQYAILSHTWGDEEVSFQDMAELDRAKGKAGFKKIEQTCSIAHTRGLTYAWVDTCCIDKSSSAELTEAINSMFEWYKKSDVCFVYLFDYDVPMPENDISGCRWLSRGWTLQELIASREVEFYDWEWKILGDKKSFQSQLSDITGIDAEVLENSDRVSTVPIARRMSWAASRTTTRIEDTAYCLFGIFDVNLPLIYGEGKKAFIRLQEAIARESTDLSLFAWDASALFGAFARSPADFIWGYDICWIRYAAIPSVEYTLTNKGLHIRTLLYQKDDEYILMLHCERLATVDESIAVRLARTAHGYVRLGLTQVPTSFASTLQPLQMETSVYIPKTISLTEFEAIKMEFRNRFRVRMVVNCDSFTVSFKPVPEHLWDSGNGTFITHGPTYFTGMIEITIDKPRRLFAEHPTWEYPVIKVVILLKDTTRSWAAVFSTYPEEGVFDPFDGLEHRNGKDPYLLDAVRFALSPLLEGDLPTPTSLTVVPRSKFRNVIVSLDQMDIERYAVKVTLNREHRPNNIPVPYKLTIELDKAYKKTHE